MPFAEVLAALELFVELAAGRVLKDEVDACLRAVGASGGGSSGCWLGARRGVRPPESPLYTSKQADTGVRLRCARRVRALPLSALGGQGGAGPGGTSRQ